MIKNSKIFEDFFDDIKSDEIIDTSVEDKDENNTGWKDYSHNISFDMLKTSCSISPMTSTPFKQMITFLNQFRYIHNYCLKIEYKDDRHAQPFDSIIYNPLNNTNVFKFFDDYVNNTNSHKELVIRYTLSFDIAQNIPFSKFVKFYIFIAKFLSAGHRKQSLTKPSYQFRYMIMGTYYDGIQIFDENTYQTIWELTDTSQICSRIDTLKKIYDYFGCSSEITEKTINEIIDAYGGTLYKLDKTFLKSHFGLIYPFSNSEQIRVKNFYHSGNTHVVYFDRDDIDADKDEAFSTTYRMMVYKMSDIIKLINSEKETYFRLTWTIGCEYQVMHNVIVDEIQRNGDKENTNADISFESISNARIDNLNTDDFLYFCENIADENTNIHIDSISDITDNKPHEFDLEVDWTNNSYQAYDNPSTGPKFSVEVKNSRKKAYKFKKMIITRLK